MKIKETIGMLLLGVLLALSSCAKPPGIGAVSGLVPIDHQKLKERYKSLINKITRMEEQL